MVCSDATVLHGYEEVETQARPQSPRLRQRSSGYGTPEKEGAGGGAPPPAQQVSAPPSAAGDEHDEGTATPAVVIISPSPSLDNSARVSELHDEEMVSPAVSPDEEVWRRDVAQTALSRQLTSAAKRHPEVNMVTQLLRNAISEARDLPGGLPQSQIDPIYDRVTALFVSEERGVAGRRKGHGRVSASRTTPPIAEAGHGGGACSEVTCSLHHRRRPLRWFSLETGQPVLRARANGRFPHLSTMGDPFYPNFSCPITGVPGRSTLVSPPAGGHRPEVLLVGICESERMSC
nr:unnamed protein product [Callosobruchus analis]